MLQKQEKGTIPCMHSRDAKIKSKTFWLNYLRPSGAQGVGCHVSGYLTFPQHALPSRKKEIVGEKLVYGTIAKVSFMSSCQESVISEGILSSGRMALTNLAPKYWQGSNHSKI